MSLHFHIRSLAQIVSFSRAPLLRAVARLSTGILRLGLKKMYSIFPCCRMSVLLSLIFFQHEKAYDFVLEFSITELEKLAGLGILC